MNDFCRRCYKNEGSGTSTYPALGTAPNRGARERKKSRNTLSRLNRTTDHVWYAQQQYWPIRNRLLSYIVCCRWVWARQYVKPNNFISFVVVCHVIHVLRRGYRNCTHANVINLLLVQRQVAERIAHVQPFLKRRVCKGLTRERGVNSLIMNTREQ